MTRASRPYFWELDFSEISDAAVIVDIDGTLSGAGNGTAEEKVKDAIERLKQRNEVHLFSNHRDVERLKRLADEFGILHIVSFRRKPNPNIMRDFLSRNSRKKVVIGDKVLTDGLFAFFIGARFIKVRRVRHDRETFMTRVHYFLDDFASFLSKAMKLRK